MKYHKFIFVITKKYILKKLLLIHTQTFAVIEAPRPQWPIFKSSTEKKRHVLTKTNSFYKTISSRSKKTQTFCRQFLLLMNTCIILFFDFFALAAKTSYYNYYRSSVLCHGPTSVKLRRQTRRKLTLKYQITLIWDLR